MKLAAALFAFLVTAPILSASARADVADLGGIKLGDKYKKGKPKKVTLYGCAGKLYGSAPATGKDKGKRVDQVTFESDKCPDAATADAISKAFGAAPVVNADGARLWEGTTGSVITSKMLGNDAGLVVRLVAPVPDGKRVCWAKDGFAEFWAGFVKAAASGKHAAAAASFVFPLKDEDGNFEIKSAKELDARWAELFSADDLKEITSGSITPPCDLYESHYTISLGAANADLHATRAADGTWKWSSLSLVSPD